MMAITLSPAERVALLAAAQWFLPPDNAYPSFAEADPDDQVLHLVLEQLAPLQDEIHAALAAVPAGDVEEYMGGLSDADAAQFETLRTLCLGWYFTCRPVWELLGYTGRRPVPITEGEADHHLRGGILDPVIERGKIYRPA